MAKREHEIKMRIYALKEWKLKQECLTKGYGLPDSNVQFTRQPQVGLLTSSNSQELQSHEPIQTEYTIFGSYMPSNQQRTVEPTGLHQSEPSFTEFLGGTGKKYTRILTFIYNI